MGALKRVRDSRSIVHGLLRLLVFIIKLSITERWWQIFCMKNHRAPHAESPIKRANSIKETFLWGMYKTYIENICDMCVFLAEMWIIMTRTTHIKDAPYVSQISTHLNQQKKTCKEREREILLLNVIIISNMYALLGKHHTRQQHRYIYLHPPLIPPCQDAHTAHCESHTFTGRTNVHCVSQLRGFDDIFIIFMLSIQNISLMQSDVLYTRWEFTIYHVVWGVLFFLCGFGKMFWNGIWFIHLCCFCVQW